MKKQKNDAKKRNVSFVILTHCHPNRLRIACFGQTEKLAATDEARTGLFTGGQADSEIFTFKIEETKRENGPKTDRKAEIRGENRHLWTKKDRFLLRKRPSFI